MMHFIVGALVSVEKGTIEIEDMEYALYVTCAPSHGLSLVHVQNDAFGNESFD